MTTVAHILSGSLMGLYVAGVSPNETPLVVTSILSAGLLDLDHLVMLFKNRAYFKKNGYMNTLHKARSFIHELLGFFLIGVLMLIVSFFNLKLALVLGISAMIHLVEDVIMGISIPFSPMDSTEMHLVPQKNKLKIIVDIVLVITFGVLWIIYLTGQK